ncbi:acyltransferase family protein [Burkholderia sp. S171]|uniref:acyltransferase family protein n=1 Tax=Burkholderia sp. S171 TaxID=1641860 RepID=UPI00131AE6E4|nr:acyltransferase [Burkholderia sp. S171]
MRNTFLDCTRGLGICLVVFGHVQRGLSDAHLLPANYPVTQIDFTLYTFHMPLFFLLAGLYVWPALEKGRGSFIGSKFMTIVVPYFVWSIIQGGVQIAMAHSTNHPLSLSDWPKLFYAPLGQFWFLYALMIWQIVAFACGRRGPALMVVAILALAFSTALPDSILSTTMKMGIFFAAGAAIGPGLERHVASFAHWKSFLVCCGAFGLAVHAIWNVAPVYSWQALPAAIFGMGIIMIVCYRANQMLAKAPLVLCGQRSMHIYVMHIMAAAGIRIVLTKAGVDNGYALLLIGTAAGIVLPLGVSHALQRAGSLVRGTLPATRTGMQS